MHRNPHTHARQGFTLFELLVVIAIISIMATIATPNLLRLIQRSKLTGFAQETSVLMRAARQSAIRYNTQAIVWADQTNKELVSWVDVDGPSLGDPPDMIFNPVPGQPHRSTDFEVARLSLPSRIKIEAPAGEPAPCLGVPVCEFTDVGAEKVAVFLPDGSVDNDGAIRFADPYGNYLQVEVAPASTARVRIEKFNDVDLKWYIRNETGKPWEWK